MKSNIKLYPQKLLVSVWQRYGEKVYRGFQVDQECAHYVRFFCQEREQYYPALKDNPNKGFFVYGSKGVGKTLNFFVYRKIQTKYGERGMMIISAKQIETNFKINGEAYISMLVNVPELMIDDIGTESQVLKDYGTDRNLIHDILIQRYVGFQRGENITHGTTNLSMDLLKQFYDARLFDRMKEMFIPKKIVGESKRK